MNGKYTSAKPADYEGNPPEIRSRYRLKNRTASAAQVLASVLKRSGLKQKLDKYQFVQFWPQIVGKAIAAQAKPEALRNGTLLVRVKSSAWAQELSFQKSVIKKRLNNFLGSENAVKDVKFYVSSEDQLAMKRSARKLS